MTPFQQYQPKAIFLTFALCFTLTVFFCMGNAMAQSYYVDPSLIQNCSTAPPWMVTTRIVQCVENGIRGAMMTYLINMTDVYRFTIFMIMTFSVVLFGIKVFAGLEDITKDSMLFIVKLAMVYAFSFYLFGMWDAPFAILKYATSLVVGQWSPWNNFDIYLGKLFGFGGTTQLFNGLMGMVFAALFSGVTGLLVMILALLAMITTVYFSFRAMLTYLSSVVLVGFLVALTPLIVPLALFSNTNRYVSKWLDYLIAAIVHTVVLFAFLYMFVGMINSMLDWMIVDVFGTNDFSSYFRGNRNMFSWMMTSDPATVKMLENTLGEQTNRTAMQSFMSPVMSNAVDINPVSTYALDFGPNQVWAMQLMAFGFLGLFIVSYLMLSMLNYLPEVADAIAGVATGLRLEGIPFVSEFRQSLMKMKGAIT